MTKNYRAMWEAGIVVFPLNTFKDGMCGCGDKTCTAIGKHPRMSNWQHAPHWDEEQLDNIEAAGWFDSGFGVSCKGLLVIDVDVRNGGEKGYAALLEDFPEVAGAGMIVKTGRGDGGRHLYFRLPEGAALVQKLDKYQGIDFKSSGFVVGAGSRHASGGLYQLVVGGPDEIDDAPAGLLEALRKPDRHRAEYDGMSVDVSHSDIADMLGHISPDCEYDTWIRIGMSIHHSTGGTGFAVWDEWSGRGEKYDSATMDSHWHSFGRAANPVTLGTLIHHAEQGGWLWPVSMGAPPEHEEEPEGETPFDLSGIDLKRPPGFTGRVAEWIGKKPIMPRDHLAVGGAIFALGSIYSLHYTSQTSRATTNMLVFCVAGSRTGKESIEQGVIEVISAAGYGEVIGGKIKSEQEIIRNLIRNQASFHAIDEIGLELQKLKNAQQRGGTPYLEGIIGTIMSAYGKANGVLPLTGDVKQEAREGLMKKLSSLMRKRDENEGGPRIDEMISQVEAAIKRTSEGLPKPILSIIGFTTPVTFDGLLDFNSGTNGFIGRALMFVEHETTPKPRKNFIAPDMPDDIKQTLMMLGSGGRYEDGDRIENYSPRTVVPDTDEAREAMGAISEWLHEKAVAEKANSGLESLWLGSYELVEKVSLILAVPEGMRTMEHVRWAFARVVRDVEDKIRAITVNDRAKDSPGTALEARILNICGGDDGERIGVIVNRCRGVRKEDVHAAVAKLAANGKLVEIEGAKSKGPKTKYFKKA